MAAIVDSIPVRCGELACQKDSYLQSTRARVVSCAPHFASPLDESKQSGGKKKGKSKAKSKSKKDAGSGKGAPLFDVVLQDSVMFPEGGGQPSDRGTVGGVECLRCDNVAGTATHVCAAPVAEGAEVDVEIDWDRRWDHMTQHSAQHLVTALAVKLFGFETTSWNLGEQQSFIELGTPELSVPQLTELEAATNAAIRDGRAVAPSWHSVDDVNEGRVPGLRVSSKALPPSVTGPVRVITFDGIDTNSCCGTHVKSMAHLQLVKLLRAEKSKGSVKLWFVAGKRVLRSLGDTFGRQQQLGALLSVGPEGLAERVGDLAAKQRAAEKAGKAMAGEIVGLIAAEIKARVAGEAGEAGEAKTEAAQAHVHRQRVASYSRGPPDVAPVGPLSPTEFLKGLSSAVTEGSTTVLIATVAAAEGGGGAFMVAADKAEDVAVVGPVVAAALDGRGGGKGNRFQGKCRNIDAAAVDAAVEAARDALVAAAAPAPAAGFDD